MASVQVYKSGKNEYVRIVESYRDEITGKPRTKVIKALGNKADLERDDPGIVERLKAELKESREAKKNLKREEQSAVLQRILQQSCESTPAGAPIKNYGHLVYKKLWNDLKLDYFFDYRQKKDSNINFKTKEIASMLTIMRLLFPSSKKRSFALSEKLWNCPEMDLHHIYRFLSFIAEHKENLETHLNKQLKRLYPRNLGVCFYDVTTYYFEFVCVDELKKFGFSKDNKVNHVQVVMGLLIDDQGIPISYELFPGNTSDFKTLTPVMERLKTQHGINKIIITADRGLNSKANLALIRNLGYEYVMAYKIRTAAQSVKSLVLDPTGYTTLGKDFRFKKTELTTNVTLNGTKHSFTDNFILTYSEKRAHKDRSDRSRLVEKAKKISESKSLMNSELKKGGKKYVQLTFMQEDLHFDESKVLEDARYDGYYGIVSSDQSLDPMEVVDIYQGLWKIEESFRVMKSNLEARPIFVWTAESIQGHFAICYLSLVIERYLEYLLKKQEVNLSTEVIQDALRSANLTVLKEEIGTDYYIKNASNQEFADIMEALGLKDLPSYGRTTEIKI